MRRADHARRIFDLLVETPEVGYRPHEIAESLGMLPGDTFRRAVRRAARIAAAEGYCLTTACPANGFTMTLTREAERILDSALHVGRTKTGVGDRGHLLDDYLVENAAPGSDAAVFAPIVKMEREISNTVATMRAQLEVAILETRRERRRAERASG